VFLLVTAAPYAYLEEKEQYLMLGSRNEWLNSLPGWQCFQGLLIKIILSFSTAYSSVDVKRLIHLS